MREVVKLPLIIEASAGGKKNWKIYGTSGQTPEKILRLTIALDQACEPCPLRDACLSTRDVFDQGRAMRFKAIETTNPDCRIPKTRGSLSVEMVDLDQPRTYRSVMAQILG